MYAVLDRLCVVRIFKIIEVKVLSALDSKSSACERSGCISLVFFLYGVFFGKSILNGFAQFGEVPYSPDFHSSF